MHGMSNAAASAFANVDLPLPLVPITLILMDLGSVKTRWSTITKKAGGLPPQYRYRYPPTLSALFPSRGA